MQRYGYDLSLTHDRNGWRATFLYRSHILRPWVGQVLTWWPTPWRAVHEAAWRALNTPFAHDYSVVNESNASARDASGTRTRPAGERGLSHRSVSRGCSGAGSENPDDRIRCG